jgi:hypothetical protein
MTEPGGAHPEEVMLHAFLDRGLDAEEQAAIDVHLAGCPFCAARLAELQALFARLEDLPDTPLQRRLDGDVLASIRRGAAEPRAYRVAIAVQLALGALVLVLARHWVIDALTGLTSIPLQDRLVASVSDAFGDLSLLWPWVERSVASLPNPFVDWVPRLPAIPFVMSQWGPVMAAALALWLAGNSLLLRSPHVGRKSRRSALGGRGR